VSKKEHQKHQKQQKQLQKRERLAALREALGYNMFGEDMARKEIRQAMEDGQFKQAEWLLLDYVEKHPNNIDALDQLGDVCQQTRNLETFRWVSEKILQLHPNNLMAYFRFFTAASTIPHPAGMVWAAKKIKKRCPRYKETLPRGAEELDGFIRGALEMELPIVTKFRKDMTKSGYDVSGCSDEQIIELLRDQELVTTFLPIKRFNETILLCERLIRKFPFFQSAYNNRSLAILFEYGPDRAEESLNEALERKPNNVCSLCYKLQQLSLLGKREEMQPYIERLRSLTLPEGYEASNYFGAKIEGFAWAHLEDDVIATYIAARKNSRKDEWDNAPIYQLAKHYAATAYALKGERKKAIALWKECDAIPIAMINLEDIQKPEGKRNGAWYFDFAYWIPHRCHTEFRKICKKHQIFEDIPNREKQAEQYIPAACQQILQQYPCLYKMFIEILRYGDEMSRHWVFIFVSNDKSCPREVVEALIEFTQSSCGSDELRSESLRLLQEAGVLPEISANFFVKGEKENVQTTHTKIYFEPKDIGLAEPALTRLQQATELMHHGEFQQALNRFNKLSSENPNNASLLFNAAQCRRGLGEEEQFRDAIDDIAKRFPDYIHGQIAIASLLIDDLLPNEAYLRLIRIFQKEELHTSEAKNLFLTLTQCCLARNEVAEAKNFYQMLKKVADRFPTFSSLQKEINELYGLNK
jgi:Flp pilus assembly protein TadD